MLCNTDILQLFFQDLNQFMSPHKISYHYISSVTVSCSNRHPVHAGCLLSRHVLRGQLGLEGGADRLSQNVGTQLPLYAAHNPRRQQVSKLVQFQCALPSGECKMVEYKCVLVTLLQKMSTGVKSHDLPGQTISPTLSTQHPCCRFKSFFISKNHHT